MQADGRIHRHRFELRPKLPDCGHDLDVRRYQQTVGAGIVDDRCLLEVSRLRLDLAKPLESRIHQFTDDGSQTRRRCVLQFDSPNLAELRGDLGIERLVQAPQDDEAAGAGGDDERVGALVRLGDNTILFTNNVSLDLLIEQAHHGRGQPRR